MLNIFSGCSGLTNITIPNSVTSIGSGAFCNCSGLTSITIPNSVASIGERTFQNCSSMTSITIPNSVTSIGKYVFFGCIGLTSVTIPNSVISIEDGAFLTCSGLMSITIPNSVTSIKRYAFEYCSGLKSVNIPESVTSIASSAFHGCSGLTSITIPNSVTRIEGRAFAECPELANVYCYATNLPLTSADAFQDSYIEYATLHIPEAAIEEYKTTAPWSSIKNIMSIESEFLVTISSEGFATSCPNVDVDFTTVSGMKAYIGSMFNRQTGVLTMTRAYDVPAGTGLVLKGEPGTYSIPTCESFTVISNLLKGVTEATNINATEDGYVNYVLNNGSLGVGFYKVGTAGASLEAGRAYLQIPAETASSRSALKLRFDDEEESTAISDVERQEVNTAVYDLQGRRVEQPQRGLYIRNGKKVIIK